MSNVSKFGDDNLIKAIKRVAEKERLKQVKQIEELGRKLEPIEQRITQLLEINKNNQTSEIIYVQIDSIFNELCLLCADEIKLWDEIYRVNLEHLSNLSDRLDLCLAKILDIEKMAKKMG